MASLLKWKVDSPPVGRYRSFDVRGWPSAQYTKSGKAAAHVTCQDERGNAIEYHPATARDHTHPELQVFVADWSYSRSPELKAKFGAFKYRRLTARPKTLEEAKALAEAALRAHPLFQPEEESNG